jgi:hypothetical protein
MCAGTISSSRETKAHASYGLERIGRRKLSPKSQNDVVDGALGHLEVRASPHRVEEVCA